MKDLYAGRKEWKAKEREWKGMEEKGRKRNQWVASVSTQDT